jgi:hypothetical protein
LPKKAIWVPMLKGTRRLEESPHLEDLQGDGCELIVGTFQNRNGRGILEAFRLVHDTVLP